MWRPDEDEDYLSSAVTHLEEEQLQNEEDEINTTEILSDIKQQVQSHQNLTELKGKTDQNRNELEELAQEMKMVGINFAGELSRKQAHETEDDGVLEPDIIMSGNIPIFRADHFFEPNLLHPDRANSKPSSKQVETALRDEEEPTGPLLITVPKTVLLPPEPLIDPFASLSKKKKNKGAKGKKTKFKPAQQLWGEAEIKNMGPDCRDVCNPRQASLYRKFNN